MAAWTTSVLMLSALLIVLTLCLTSTAPSPSSERAKKNSPHRHDISTTSFDDKFESSISSAAVFKNSAPAVPPVAWSGSNFPPFIQVPSEFADVKILSSSELLLDNGAIIRLTLMSSKNLGPRTALSVEIGDASGTIIHRGIAAPDMVRIEHPPELSDAVFERLKAAGLAAHASSSLSDRRMLLAAPKNPHEIVDFISSIQEQVGSSGMVHLLPIREEWGNTTAVHNPHYVSIR